MILFDKSLESQLDKWIRIYFDKCTSSSLIKSTKPKSSVYLLIGCWQNDDDLLVVRAAQCPNAAEDIVAEDLSSAPAMDAEWIVDHACRLIRILPGGLDIVGVCLVGVGERETRSMLIRAMSLIGTASQFGCHRSTINRMLLCVIDRPLVGGDRPTGSMVNIATKALISTNDKIIYQALNWIALQSTVGIDLHLPISVNGSRDFRKLFAASLSDWSKQLFATDFALVDGCIRNATELLSTNKKKQRKSTTTGSSNDAVQIQLFIASSGDTESIVIKDMDCNVHIKLAMQVSAVVPQKATVETGILAIKKAVMRSLNSRVDLHSESMDVVENDAEDVADAVHQLPRMVTTNMPGQPAIVLSDYLFESDTVTDAVDTFRQMLGVDVHPDDIDDSVERSLSADDLAAMDMPSDAPTSDDQSSVATVAPSMTRKMYLLVAALVALIAIAAAILYTRLYDL